MHTSNLTREFKKIYLRRWMAENGLVLLLQYMGLMMSTLSAVASPLWLATGTASAFIFLRGYSVLPGIALGTFFSYFFAHAGFTVALGAATLFTLQAALLLALCYRAGIPTLIFYRISKLLTWIAISSLLTLCISFMLTTLCYTSLSVPMSFLTLWLQTWLANLNGILVFSCALITLDAYFPEIQTLRLLNKTRLSCLYGLLIFLILCFLGIHPPSLSILITLSLLALTLFISRYYGWCGAVSSVFLIGLLFHFAAFWGLSLTLITTPALLCLLAIVCLITALPAT